MLRLIVLVLLLLVSLLAVFKAFTYHLWLAAVLVTEFAVFWVLITAGILVYGFWIPKFQLPGTVVGIITLGFFLSPIFRAYWLAHNWEQKSDLVFDAGTKAKQPVLSVARMFSLGKINVVPQTSTYAEGLTLDFYTSKKSGFQPCVIVIHGGSWKSGDNKQLPELNSYLANAGYHVAAINYRLAPKYKSPSAVEDVQKAIMFLKNHSATLHIDTTNLVLLGRSAGAQIALLAAYTLNDRSIKGVVDFYGPADMVWGYSVPSNPWVMNSRKVMEDYLGGTYTEVPQQYLESSPIHFVSKSSVPTLIIHGENDVLVAYEHSLRLQKMLNEHEVKNYFLSLPWATHGFDYNINGPGGQLSTFAVRQFHKHVIK